MKLKFFRVVMGLFKNLFFLTVFSQRLQYSPLRVYFGKGITVNIGGNGKIKIGRNVRFRNYNCLNVTSGELEIGNDVFVNNFCSFNCHFQIKIGNNTMIGENVKIYDHNHSFRTMNKLISEQGFTYGAIEVGNNVWIGSNVVILKGAKIGDNCVIGSNTVIDCPIKDNSIVFNERNLIVKERVDHG